MLYQLNDVDFAIPKGFAYGIICPITGVNQEYKQLLQGPDGAKWLQGGTNEMGRLLLGIDPLKDGPSGTDINNRTIPIVGRGDTVVVLRVFYL